MKTSHRIISGDSRQMKETGDESVHLVITSPPYWQLKDYGGGEQIGYNNTYEEYINNLNLVWKECHRVLHKACRLCVNIGDQFARSVYYGRYKVIPIRTEIIKFCEAAGFDYMGAVIWQKVTTTNTSGGATIMGSFPYPRNGILKLDYEFILLFKKPGDPPPVSQEIKEQSKMSTEEWNQFFAGHWNFTGEKQGRHIAMFPEELPRRLIKMFSFVGDTVLDPFLGSGTTSLAAKNLGRNSVGYEINEEFLPIIEEKIGCNQTSMFDEADFRIIRQKKPPKGHFAREIEKLPYIFKDKVIFDKKADPKKFRFGSRIDATRSMRETYFSVREVLDAATLVLSDGRTVKLLGVKQSPGTLEEAVRFLQEKTKGQRVFLRSDPKRNGEDNGVLFYMYLKNRTCLNARMIKSGFSDVDTDLDYRMKKRFLRYSKSIERG
ncbi:MAG: site-specific DNA-methyltransferase [Nitrospinae bacterium]|nr:site-specific DNA-methyltransferase [Nitrospinota bacterium]